MSAADLQKIRVAVLRFDDSVYAKSSGTVRTFIEAELYHRAVSDFLFPDIFQIKIRKKDKECPHRAAVTADEHALPRALLCKLRKKAADSVNDGGS